MKIRDLFPFWSKHQQNTEIEAQKPPFVRGQCFYSSNFDSLLTIEDITQPYGRYKWTKRTLCTGGVVSRMPYIKEDSEFCDFSEFVAMLVEKGYAPVKPECNEEWNITIIAAQINCREIAEAMRLTD